MRFLVRIAHFLRSIYWRVVQPNTFGVKAILLNEAKQVLLVQHSYGQQKQWVLPGGSIRRSETVVAAVERELWEELKMPIVESRIFGEYVSKQEGKTDNVTVVVCSTNSPVGASTLEISAARFFDPNELPTGVSPATKRRLHEFLRGDSPSQEW